MQYVFASDHRHDLPLADVKALLGSKAANIAVMVNELGLPVPPAFTISTVACRAHLAGGWPDGLDAQVRDGMARVEAAVGRRFGDAMAPLLVSVRSGAPISMPGMMDTILNLGLNDATEAGLALASGDPAFAANCRRRFEAMYRDIVGVDEVPADPWTQLRGAIEAVFRSWNSDRARAYRAHEGIPDDLGTGVTVQAMVFGNSGTDSGTGVLFTRNPATGERACYGDVMFDAQGEDVVAGTHATEPIAILDVRMPGVAAQLRANAERLERHYRDVCDIEFTIERGRLWMLQTRVGKRSPQAALRIAVDMADDPQFPLTRAEAVERVKAVLADPPVAVTQRAAGVAALTRGLGASPGIACGEIAVTPDAAVAIAAAGRAVILVRSETSPDDVHGMAKSAGILTASGGLASHAAVVARGWNIPAVVGAPDVAVGADGVDIAGLHLAAGEVITIDGGTGEVFAGAVGGTSAVVPEVAVLLRWAHDLGIAIGPAAGAPGVPDAPESADSPAWTRPVEPVEPTADDILRALLVKGYATPEAAGVAAGCPTEAAPGFIAALVAEGLAEPAAGAFRLTAAGKARGAACVADDRARWGEAEASAALDAFLVLDGRMKATVTSWQMREVNGSHVLNDHADAAYDAGVLASLAALHVDTSAWLAPLVARLPRLRCYLDRLDRAAGAVAGGNGTYIASPRVDSYHGAWFELHEDLILLAGRNRADEVAAGRA